MDTIVCHRCHVPKPPSAFGQWRSPAGKPGPCLQCRRAAYIRLKGQPIESIELISCHLCHLPQFATEFYRRSRVKICYSCRALLADEPITDGCKRCAQCFTAKPLDDFHPHPTRLNPECRKGTCRTCIAENRATAEALTKCNDYRRMRYATDPGWRDAISAQGKEWREANPEKALENITRWQKEHPDKVHEYARNNRLAHPEEQRAKRKRYRARKKHAPINDLTAEQWEIIKAAYGYRCVYCGRKMKRLTQDHITPLAQGGSHTLSNIVPACLSCNGKKGDRGVPVPVQPLLL